MYDVKEGKAPGFGWVLFLFHKEAPAAFCVVCRQKDRKIPS